ncbi:MAG TPA: P-loop NTPase fold protein [Pyrinomonadaceae bacterium]
MQSPRPDAFRPPQVLLSFSWWRYPLEWNAPARLPKIESDFNALYVAPKTETVWAVGNKGLVAVSTDGGATWNKRGISASQVIPASSPTPGNLPKDPPKRPRNNAFLNFPDLIPTAAAANISAKPNDLLEVGSATPAPTVNPGQRDQSIQGATPTASPTRSTDESPSATPARGSVNPPGSLIAVTVLDDVEPTWPPSSGTVAVGEDLGQSTRIFITSDGGATWSIEPLYDWFFSQWRQGKWEVPLVAPTIPSRLYGIYSQYPRTMPSWWTVGPAGGVWLISGPTAIRLQTGSSDDLYGVYFLDDGQRGWVSGSNGAILATSDGGTSWHRQISGTTSQLNAIVFLADGRRGWVVGNYGLVLSTDDGGATWLHRTQGNDASGSYLRFPAPWFFVVLFVVAPLLLRRAKVQPPEAEESVADVLVSDRPLDSSVGDVLAFNSIALGLSRFLRNENTMPPLTIAIVGEWGTGKSSLMNLLRADLSSYKFRPVWFNAWHHQKEEHMLASLLENIKLQAVPRWWSNRGLVFRAKLLGIRGWRHWLPLVLLVFFIYVLLIYHFGREGTDATYGGLMNWLATAVSHPLETAPNLVPFVPLLAGICTFLGAVWRGITAFGVKPASLLAGVSSGASIRGLEAQTSFRQKFAVEFNDVTRALGNRSLLIFIDDLDRCRPENVLETLEAVNFLTTSGECFVVIGMAREYVERCVGRAFKDIAEEMMNNLDKPQPVNGEDQSPNGLAKEKRIEFARQYLDKLINIEVPIPAAKQGQSLQLLLAGAYQPSAPEPKGRWREFKSSTAGLLARHWRVFPALTALAVLLTLGYFLAMSLIAQSPGSPATTQSVATPDASPSPPQTPTPTPTSATVGTSTPTPTPTALPRPSPSPTAEILNERAEIIAGGRGLFSRSLLPGIALLVMLWAGVTVLTRRPDLVVKDSPNFVDALKIWHPLIFSRQSTPRSIKRFMNRIRYLAMRQRKATASEQSWLRRLFASFNQPGETQPGTGPVTESPVDPIPDEALVALAAIEHFSKSVFGDSAPGVDWPPKKIRSTDSVVTYTYHADLQNLLTTARAEHEKRFGNFDVLKYRDRFVDIAASVEIR